MMTTMLADDAVSAVMRFAGWLCRTERLAIYSTSMIVATLIMDIRSHALLLALTFYHQSTTPAVSVTEWTGPR